jgi:hypothetical protein
MNANLTAKMNEDETKVIITLTFTGKGWDQKELVDREAAKYADALQIGMVYDQDRYVAEVEPTEGACNPFVEFAEKHGLEIIQM